MHCLPHIIQSATRIESLPTRAALEHELFDIFECMTHKTLESAPFIPFFAISRALRSRGLIEIQE